MVDDPLVDEREYRSALSTIIAYKYLFFCLFGFGAAYLAYSDFGKKNLNEGLVSTLHELVPGILAALSMSVLYDFAIRRQEEIWRKLEQNSLLRKLSRQTFLTSGLDGLNHSDVSDLCTLMIADRRFRDRIVEKTVELGGNYGQRAIGSLLHSLWDGSAGKLQDWQNRLLKNPDDPETYFCESVQTLEWRSESKTFRVILTQKAVVGANIINLGERFDGVIAVPAPLNEAIAKKYSEREHHRIKIHFEDKAYPDINVLPTLTLYQSPAGSDAPDLEGTQVYLLEFALPVDNMKGKGRVSIEWYSKLLLAVAEPFCYVQADSLLFLHDLTIEYSQIADTVGKVWVAGFIGSIGCVINHNPEQKNVVVKVNGAMMPGQGIALVWDPKPRAGG